jgi:uncharacterized protein (TIGR00255 family)
MTGFASAMKTTERYDIFMELKSVNSRYFEFKLHTSYLIGEMELEIKDILFRELERGKLDLFVKVVEKDASNYRVIVNHELASMYEGAFRSIAEKLGVGLDVTLRDMISMDGVMNLERIGSDPEAEKLIREMLGEMLVKIKEMMFIEGKKTREDIEKSLSIIADNVTKIESIYPGSLEKFKDSLKERIAEFSSKGYDDNRILMEVELVASRTAINEEIVRLKSHLKQFGDIISGKNSGDSKKLDFISQELNSEANTIASKSFDYDIVESTIAVKSELEKIREQLRNLV